MIMGKKESPSSCRRLRVIIHLTTVRARALPPSFFPRMKQHAAQAAQVWQPAKYLQFETYRLRPALELLNRIPALQSQRDNEPIQIVDLGAGSGNMGPAFLYVLACYRPRHAFAAVWPL